jgi:hypothetical protein
MIDNLTPRQADAFCWWARKPNWMYFKSKLSKSRDYGVPPDTVNLLLWASIDQLNTSYRNGESELAIAQESVDARDFDDVLHQIEQLYDQCMKRMNEVNRLLQCCVNGITIEELAKLYTWPMNAFDDELRAKYYQIFYWAVCSNVLGSKTVTFKHITFTSKRQVVISHDGNRAYRDSIGTSSSELRAVIDAVMDQHVGSPFNKRSLHYAMMRMRVKKYQIKKKLQKVFKR